MSVSRIAEPESDQLVVPTLVVMAAQVAAQPILTVAQPIRIAAQPTQVVVQRTQAVELRPATVVTVLVAVVIVLVVDRAAEQPNQHAAQADSVMAARVHLAC